MALEHITDHADQAADRLLEQDRDKPLTVAVARAIGDRAQTVEDALWGILDGCILSGSVGVQVDGEGRLVGEPRAGKDDPTYKLYIRVRRLLNRASGTGPDILAIFEALTAGAGLELVLEEQFPAALVVRTVGGPCTTPTDFARILQLAKAAGVRAFFEWSGTPPAQTFTFLGGPGLGFATLTTPGSGGHFAEAEE